MSIRERAQVVFDSLTDEQLADFVMMYQEPPNTAHSAEEIDAMLEEAEDDIRNGRVVTKEEMDVFFRENFGV